MNIIFILGFPLDKAIEYVKLRKPYSLNDLEMQKISFLYVLYFYSSFMRYLFFDRRIIHQILKDNVGTMTVVSWNNS